jgi:hypothetical protein
MKHSTSVQSTVRIADIPAIIDDPKRGIVSLVGNNGGLSQITGWIEESKVVMGSLSIETEHGTVYLDPNETTPISEAFPLPDTHEWEVAWKIDGYGSTPEEAAAKVWRDVFGRTLAGTDDACVFIVTDVESGESTRVDLSEDSPVSVQD